MSERSGVEIDYCPQCRGVWLDRGELDKIIDRVNAGAPEVPPAPIRPAPASPAPGMVPSPLYRNSEPRRDQPRYDDRSYGKGYDSDNDRRRHKKKEGWLGDLFDF
jgi:Zn-finger nucleic acid-binding protein